MFVRVRLCLNINHRIFRVGRAPWRFHAHLLYREIKLIEGTGFAKIAPSVSGGAGTRTYILQAMLVCSGTSA